VVRKLVLNLDVFASESCESLCHCLVCSYFTLQSLGGILPGLDQPFRTVNAWLPAYCTLSLIDRSSNNFLLYS
jgi:hypothetical protein